MLYILHVLTHRIRSVGVTAYLYISRMNVLVIVINEAMSVMSTLKEQEGLEHESVH